MDHKKVNQITIWAALATIIIILISVLLSLVSVKSLDIVNFDQINSSLSSSERTDLENYIASALEGQLNIEGELKDVKALIRNSSYQETPYNGTTNYNFLVDIDEFKKTYLVDFTLIDGQGFYESPTINYPLLAQLKYDDIDEAEINELAVNSIEDELPYEFYYNDKYVTMTSVKDKEGPRYIYVRVSSCGDQGLLDSVRKQVNQWIESHGYDPDNFIIKIPDYCDSSVHD